MVGGWRLKGGRQSPREVARREAKSRALRSNSSSNEPQIRAKYFSRAWRSKFSTKGNGFLTGRGDAELQDKPLNRRFNWRSL